MWSVSPLRVTDAAVISERVIEYRKPHFPFKHTVVEDRTIRGGNLAYGISDKFSIRPRTEVTLCSRLGRL